MSWMITSDGLGAWHRESRRESHHDQITQSTFLAPDPFSCLPASLIPLGGAYSNRDEPDVRGLKKSQALTGCFDDMI